MRAAYYEGNGSAREVLRVAEVETPQPGRGEVRVRLRTSGVNPSDVKSRAGLTRKIAFPRVIPHSDGAGEIEAVGEAVSPARVGERVWVWNGQWRRAFGTAAQYDRAAGGAGRAAARQVTSFEAGACLGIPAYTALSGGGAHGRGRRRDRARRGRRRRGRPLRHPVCQERGAAVITTVSSPEKAAIAQEAGADHAIDYKREHVGERVMAITAKRGVDAVIEMDLAANAKLLPDVLAPNGVVAVYGGSAAEPSIPFQFLLQNSIALKFFLVYLMPQRFAFARDRRDHAHARARRAHPQRGAELRARRHRRGARSGRGRQGIGQYRGADRIERDDFSSNRRDPALASCRSMIIFRKPVPACRDQLRRLSSTECEATFTRVPQESKHEPSSGDRRRTRLFRQRPLPCRPRTPESRSRLKARKVAATNCTPTCNRKSVRRSKESDFAGAASRIRSPRAAPS